MGVSRKCVTTWIDRYADEGEAGLHDRSSRPHHTPTKTSAEVEQQVVGCARRASRARTGSAPSSGCRPATVSRILRRHGVPDLASATRSPVR